MSNSSLVDIIKYSPNHSGERTQPISRITPHCTVGQLNANSIANLFVNKSKKASCNYAIGKDGKVALIVDEKNRSWCSSNADNDQRAVTIECASDITSPYAFNDKTYKKLLDLMVDICKRNGKTKLIWLPDQQGALHKKLKDNEMLITVHRWFATKSCPGDWLYNRLDDVAREVTKRLQDDKLYKVQVGAYSIKSNAENMLVELQKKGFNGIIVETERN